MRRLCLLGLCLTFAVVPVRAEPAHSWADRHAGLPATDDVGYAVAASPDGSRVYSAGATHTAAELFGPVATVLAHEATDGRRAWIAQPASGGPGSFEGLAVAPDGKLVAAAGGYVPGDDGPGRGLITALRAADGVPAWIAEYDEGPTAHVGFGRAAFSPDGRTVYAAGTVSARGERFREAYRIVALDAATGAVLWTQRMDDISPISQLSDLAIDPAGERVYVTGSSWFGYHSAGGTGFDIVTVAYDAATGSQLWRDRHSREGEFDLAVEVQADATTVYVAGNGPAYDDQLIAYDAATGARRWFTELPGESLVLAAAVDRGSLYVSGWRTVLGSTDLAIASFDAATGALDWSVSYDAPRHGVDYARAIAVSPDGARVYAAGPSEDAFGFDYTVVSADAATGAIEWVNRYSSETLWVEAPSSIAVASNGARIVATGAVRDATETWDWLTVAFGATTCSSGANENGVASRKVNELEASSGPLRDTVHTANCEIATLGG